MYRGEETLMALLSLSGSAGENIELYKKTLYEGAELPQERLLDNLSEAIFSVAIAAHAFDVDLESVFKRSVEKVNKVLAEKEAKVKSDAGDE
jgi:hypothetical protein